MPLVFSDHLSPDIGLPVAVGAGLVGAVGWWDDHRPLSPWVRLAIHILAAGLVVAALPDIEAWKDLEWALARHECSSNRLGD